MDDADVVDDDDWSLLVEDDGMLPVVVAGPIIVGLSVCARAMAGSELRSWRASTAGTRVSSGIRKSVVLVPGGGGGGVFGLAKAAVFALLKLFFNG